MTAKMNGLVAKSTMSVDDGTIIKKTATRERVYADPVSYKPVIALAPATFAPAAGVAVRWADGTYGVVKSVDDSWLEDGDVAVTRDESLEGVIGAGTWVVRAVDLTPTHETHLSRRVMIYTGSLR